MRLALEQVDLVSIAIFLIIDNEQMAKLQTRDLGSIRGNRESFYYGSSPNQVGKLA